MTDSTETFWDVDDTSLQTLCMNVESLAPKWGLPPLRGSNRKVAYLRGQRWKPKQVDSRTIPLGMWVTGLTPDGMVPLIGQERQFNANMTALQQLLWHDGTRQVALTKRWRDPDTGAVVAATAMAEVRPFDVEMRGPYSAKMVVEFDLADPYFYGEAQVVPLAVGVSQIVQVPGDVPTSRIVMMANGQLTTPTVTNRTPEPDIWMKMGAAVADGDRVLIDADAYRAIRESDDANLSGAVTRSGARKWMMLLPGGNDMLLTASAGAGTVDLTYAPAYL